MWRGGVQVEGKGFDGGRECVALDILRQVGMGEWKVQVMLPVPNQFGRHATRLAKRDQERWLLRKRQ